MNRLLTLLLALLLGSCIESHEEVWLHADGSGKAVLRYDLPALAARPYGGVEVARRKLEEAVADSGLLSSSRIDLREQDGRLLVTVEGTFASVRQFARLRAKEPGSDRAVSIPPALSPFVGLWQVERTGRVVEVTRSVSPGKGIPGARFLPEAQFRGRRMVTILHLPVPALQANATRIEQGGRTLIWDRPLREGLRQPLVSRFSVALPIPPWLKAGAGILCSASVWLAFSLLRGYGKGRSGLFSRLARSK